jgi:hypothetical protein
MTKRRHVFFAILFSVIPAIELESRAMSSIYVSIHIAFSIYDSFGEAEV